MKRFIILLAATVITGSCFAQPPAKHHEAVAIDPKSNGIAVFGGAEMINNQLQVSNTAWIYDGKWRMIADAGISPRWNSGLSYHQKKLYVYGGLAEDDSKKETQLNDLYVLQNDQWKYLTHGPVLEQPQLISIKNTLWLLGRRVNSSQIVEVWRYDGLNKTLVQEESITLKDATGSFYACEVEGDLMVVHKRDSSLVFTNINDESKNIEVDLLTPLSKYSLVYDKREKAFFMFGGLDANRVAVPGFWKIDGYVVEPVQVNGGPKARSSAHLVAANTSLYLFGGVAEGKMTNELWQYTKGSWSERK
jgi:hypothetical protein